MSKKPPLMTPSQYEARIAELESEIEEWQDASGLELGGDPGGVTPEGMRAYWDRSEAEAEARIRELESELTELKQLPAFRSYLVRRCQGLEKAARAARAAAERWASRLDQAHINHGETQTEVQRLRATIKMAVTLLDDAATDEDDYLAQGVDQAHGHLAAAYAGEERPETRKVNPLVPAGAGEDTPF